MSEPFQYEPASASRALCALHPETPAVSSCDRCGNFMCAACSGGPGMHCPSCREHAGTFHFPFHRQGWTFAGVWEHCSSLFKAQWLQLSVTALIFLVVSFAGSMVFQGVGTAILAGLGIDGVLAGGLVFAFAAAGSIVQAGMSLGFMRIGMDVLEGRQVDQMRLFSEFRRLPQALLAILLVVGALMVAGLLVAGLVILGNQLSTALGIALGIASGLGLVVVVIPLVLLPAAMVVHSDLDGISVVTRMWKNVNGQRLGIFGVVCIAGLLMMGGMMLCGIGYIPAFAFSQLLFVATYLAISTEGPTFQGG